MQKKNWLKNSFLIGCAIFLIGIFITLFFNWSDLKSERFVGSVQSRDGVKIAYEVNGKSDLALVFVHCWSCDRSYWKNQIEHFEKSHRVVTLDLGGHGESGLNRKDWTMESFAEDVKSVVEKLDLSDVILIGHSMGGAVAVKAAPLMPERVTAVIAVDSFTSPLPEEERKGFSQAFSDDKATEDIIRQYMFTSHSQPVIRERIVSDMMAAPRSVRISSVQHYTNLDEGPALAAAKSPVRLINSDLSPTDLAYWRKYKSDIGLAIIPGLGHFIMFEDPEELNRLIERAVEELSTK